MKPVQTLPQGMIRNTGFSGPLLYGQCLTVMGQKHIVAAIVGLRSVVCPPAIFWEITKRVVDSVDAHMRWCFAHISKKGRKISPFVANINAALAIVFEVLFVWICASFPHALPNMVGSGLRKAMRTSVKMTAFGLQTPTATSAATNKIACLYSNFTTAIATALPIYSSALAYLPMMPGCGDQTTKSGTGMVFEDRHNQQYK